MRGTMLWFNADKDHGRIETEDGERIPVTGAAFAAGARPTGERCGGTLVEFRIAGDPERHAVGVTRVVVADPRRARRRRGHMG
jgi:hypothetical protein